MSKLSKSAKKRARAIRAEIAWLQSDRTKEVWPFSEGEKGEQHRQNCLRDLERELKRITYQPKKLFDIPPEVLSLPASDSVMWVFGKMTEKGL